MRWKNAFNLFFNTKYFTAKALSYRKVHKDFFRKFSRFYFICVIRKICEKLYFLLSSQSFLPQIKGLKKILKSVNLCNLWLKKFISQPQPRILLFLPRMYYHTSPRIVILVNNNFLNTMHLTEF